MSAPSGTSPPQTASTAPAPAPAPTAAATARPAGAAPGATPSSPPPASTTPSRAARSPGTAPRTATGGSGAAGVAAPRAAAAAPAASGSAAAGTARAAAPPAAAAPAKKTSGLPLPLLLSCAAAAAGTSLITALIVAARRRSRQQHGGKRGGRGAAGGGKGEGAVQPGPCAKLKATSRMVPLADGSACLVRREIAADNSCLFNSVGYVMHKSKTRAPHLRNVVAQQVSGDRATYSDAFLGMSNEAYCAWIRQPHTWGGGIELSILAQAYGVEIAAWNIESCACHVFGEESGYKRQAMVVYNGVHYDALAVCSGPRANPEDDETQFNPRTKRGKMILAAARKLTELTHKESKFHGASKAAGAGASAAAATTPAKPPPASPAAAKANSTAAVAGGAAASAAGATANGPTTTGSGTAKVATRPRVPRKAAPAAAAAPAATGAAAGGASGGAVSAGARLQCGECGAAFADSAAAAKHAQATGHTSFDEVATSG